MRKSFLLAPVLSVSVFLIGCGGNESKVIGVWTGSDLKLAGMEVPESLKSMIKARVNSLTLEFKPDRHFEMTQEAGTWSIDKDKILLKVSSMGGKSLADAKKSLEDKAKTLGSAGKALLESQIQENQVAILSPDGKSISVNLGSSTIVFTKKPD